MALHKKWVVRREGGHGIRGGRGGRALAAGTERLGEEERVLCARRDVDLAVVARGAAFQCIKVREERAMVAHALFDQYRHLFAEASVCERRPVRQQLLAVDSAQGSVRVSDLDAAVLAILDVAQAHLCAVERGDLLDALKVQYRLFDEVHRVLQIRRSAQEDALRLDRLRCVREHRRVEQDWLSVWAFDADAFCARARPVRWRLSVGLAAARLSLLFLRALPPRLVARIVHVRGPSLPKRARLFDCMCQVLHRQHILIPKTVDYTPSAVVLEPGRMACYQLVQQLCRRRLRQLSERRFISRTWNPNSSVPGWYLFVEKVHILRVDVVGI